MTPMGLGESYRHALALAQQELGQASGAELARRLAASGAEFLLPGSPGAGPGGAIRLSFLGRPVLVSLPDARVVASLPDGVTVPRVPDAPVGTSPPDGGMVDVPQWLAILTLHYLNGASGDPLTGELIPFRDLPGGRVYDSNFEKRVRARLVRAFAHQPALLVEAGRRLGGEAVEMGDATVRVLTFPRIPVWLVLWAADEEFPAQANVLFDSSVHSYLCTEDVVVLCEQVASELISMSRKAEVGTDGA
ncbi:MAG: DUF3786 domain-containing protein [Bacillota bacterium]